MMALAKDAPLSVVVVNHQCNENAIALKRSLSSHADVRLVDSGSTFNDGQAAEFDECLGNVYYGGLLNCAHRLTAGRDAEHPVLFICSDVEVDDGERLVARIRSVFDDPRVGVYAPASLGSGHPQMWPRGSGGLRRVSFVEGFCLAMRQGLLDMQCPVDLSLNALGWGYDVHLGYLAARSGRWSVVDDTLSVHHPQSTGYDTSQAKSQRDRWYRRLERPARAYRQLATLPGFREGPLLGAMQWAVRERRANCLNENG